MEEIRFILELEQRRQAKSESEEKRRQAEKYNDEQCRTI